MLTVSDDGYIRLSLADARSTPLVHLLSGLDEEPRECAARNVKTCEISGYTEWVSLTTPTISLGWDWRLEVAGERPRYVREGPPRGNLMLLDAEARDLGAAASDTVLGTMIDAMAWQEATEKAIKTRYV